MSQIPEIVASEWINTDTPLSLASLSGKVVVVEAFQMLCPGCVLHGLPLAQNVHKSFDTNRVQVIGLHSVFEHHDAMQVHALKAFAHEYSLTFPIAVDQPSQDSALPETMRAWGLRGTPSLLIIGPDGSLVGHYFGQVSELMVGAQIASALSSVPRGSSQSTIEPGAICTPQGCPA